MNYKGCLFTLIAATMWGLIGPISKFPMEEGLSPIENAFWRAAIGWLFFAVHAYRKSSLKIEKRDVIPILIFGVTGVTIFYGAYQLAVQDAGAALASVLLYTAPAWVALMSWMFLGEKMNPAKFTALIMTVAGVVCVSMGPHLFSSGGTIHFTWFGIVCGLTSGFTYALYYIFGKTFLSRYSTPTVFLYALPVGAILLLPFFEFHQKSSGSWVCLIALALVCTYGANSFYYAGLRYLEATSAAVIATFEPVIAALLAWLWWQEKFDWTGYLGSLLILGAVMIIVQSGRNQEKLKKALSTQ